MHPLALPALALTAALTLTACFSGGSDYPSRAAPDGMGPVCGNSALIGKAIPPVRHDGNRACGFSDAVELHSVAGVRLQGRTRLNCTTARALEDWVTDTAKPAVSRATGEALISMDSWSSFRCSNRSGGRLSEHAKGNAIDIGAFHTASGERISVLTGWKTRAERRLLSKLKDGACGPFGVVLHPGNDDAHADHFHLDISYRSGGFVYCRRNP